MLTVRSRTIELAADPATFDENVPVETFEDTGRAKLEADSYLALIIGRLAETMIADDEPRKRVITDFPRAIGDIETGAGRRNSELERFTVADAFKETFRIAYSSEYKPIDEVFSDDVMGRKTGEACGLYAHVAEAHPKSPASTVADHKFYEDPSVLLRRGMTEFSHQVSKAIIAVNESDLGAEERATHLMRAERSVRGLASLSLFQFRNEPIEETVIVNGAINVAPNLQEVYQTPLHGGLSAAIRPRHAHGCPAMPSMPGNLKSLHEGSAIGKLWQMATGLVVAVNAHALNSDAPEHAVFKHSTAEQPA